VAATESVAENTADSLMAPLLYYSVAGLPGAFAYRAINTLDAMWGYHGTFEHFGKTAGRLDDLANLLPGRLTGLLLVVVAGLTGHSAQGGWRPGSGRGPQRDVCGRDARSPVAFAREQSGRPNRRAGQPVAHSGALLRGLSG
jgi:adenosylcobinamide-phosphate synthase